MANTSAKKQVHVSPGIYFSESEISAATTSLGITHLGLAGETVKGPAFQAIDISSWEQYQMYFGGTNTDKFIGSQYPKYELPYIAKTYLEQSQSLKVVRTLGLSGVNAGTAWVICAYGTSSESDYPSTNPMVVAVIRSRGEHLKATWLNDGENGCPPEYEYDKILYYASDVELEPSHELELDGECNLNFNANQKDFKISSLDYGTFTLKVTRYDGEIKKYSVSLNADRRNYIYNVIGGDPERGDAEIYVEELYDVALRQLVDREIPLLDNIVGEIKTLKPYKLVPCHKSVWGILVDDDVTLKRKDVGKRFLYDASVSVDSENKPYRIYEKDIDGYYVPITPENGDIVTVMPIIQKDGTRKYLYVLKKDKDGNKEALGIAEDDGQGRVVEVVYVDNENLYYKKGDDRCLPITLDVNNYKEQYRYASTPWVVSELKGSAKEVKLTKLFRFHTISDGDSSSTEVKISIENILPDDGKFDVIVRDFNDTDASKSILESFRGCNLIPGSENYVAYRIGSFDDSYESKSNFITIEVNETDLTRNSIPAGFLGYPTRNYSGTTAAGTNDLMQKPYLQYNTFVNDDIRIRKQYFGMSDLVGIDTDLLKYKGVEAYVDDDPNAITPCFHLDSRIFEGQPDENGVVIEDGIDQTVIVDGVKGYTWVTVAKDNILEYSRIEPRIGTEELMMDTIYEDKRYRKFTLCFYGGWDGWDYYRKSRSNGDDFKFQKYRGHIDPISGEGDNFSIIRNPEAYGFDEAEKVITSDYYAYLSAIRQFANPKQTDINVLATPGIDYVNNNLLVQETIEMVEDERADSIYVITTPDKPYGFGDSISEMYTASDVIDNLEGSEIDSNWACTYYPWIKYYDSVNSQYIYLPPTKDVVKNFAYTDNVAHPWIASAGWFRGLTDGVKSKKTLVLSEQDELYGGRVNFINNFADEGMRIWGDKNLQVEQNSQLSRISKRRCLIRLRKLISIACIGLIFDPNDNTTSQSFRSAVEPILSNFIANRALIDAKLVIDDSQESRDRLELNAQIYIKFVPNLEYINIGLKITPSGVSFDDL